MGHSVRSDKYRYTEWLHWDPETLAADWTVPFAVELYDHEDDDGLDYDKYENANLAGTPRLATVQASLAAELRQAFPLRAGANRSLF